MADIFRHLHRHAGIIELDDRNTRRQAQFHQGIDTGFGQVLSDPLDAAVDLERVRSRRPKDGPAPRQDPAHLVHPERDRPPLKLALPAVT